MYSLPFARGETYFNGSNINSNQAKDLEGKRFYVTDDMHGTGMPVCLMVVRAGTSFALGTENNRYRGVKFSTIDGEFGRTVTGFVDSVGGYGVPIDDHYTNDIQSGDLFYVVVKGPVKIRRAGATGVAGTMNAGTLVTFTSNGLMTSNAAGRVPIGKLTATIASGATGANAAKVVLVDISESAIE